MKNTILFEHDNFKHKDTFRFLHSVLATQVVSWKEVDDVIFSQHHEEVIEAYHYYDDDEYTLHSGTLILLPEKIEFIDRYEGGQDYYTLASETE